MAISAKVALILSLGFISGMSWLVHQVGQPTRSSDRPANLVKQTPTADVALHDEHPEASSSDSFRAQFAFASAVQASPLEPREVVTLPPPARTTEPASAELPALHTDIDVVERAPILARWSPEHKNSGVPGNGSDASQRVEALMPPGPGTPSGNDAAFPHEVTTANAVSPANAADPTPAHMQTYIVSPGDSLSKIASRFYGRGTQRYVDLLIAANPRLRNRPDLVQLGDELQIPPADWHPRDAAAVVASARTAEAKVPIPADAELYVVRPADSLYKIAARLLGDGTRWHEIARLNGLADAHQLRPGMKLKIPAGSGSAVASAARLERT